MIIYVDVLVFTNFIINLLLLLLCRKLTGRETTNKRLITAAFMLSLFSLIIFLPNLNLFFQIVFRIIPSVIAVLICFKYKTFKLFLLDIFVLFSITFSFAGLILGANLLITSDKISVNNGAVYFDISPLTLITSAFFFYIIILVYRKLKTRTLLRSNKVLIELCFKDSYIKVKALVDSGHSLTDMMSESEVVIIDLNTACMLFGQAESNYMVEHLMPLTEMNKERFRVMPIKTVSGSNLLPALRLESVVILGESDRKELKKPLAVIMNDSFGGDYSAIISENSIIN